MPDVLQPLALHGFIGALLVATASDAARLTISNNLILDLLAAYAGIIAILPIPLSDIVSGIVGGLAILIGGLIFFALWFNGGADVKLLAAAGSWLGAAQIPALLILTALAGGSIALAILAYRRFGTDRFADSAIAVLRKDQAEVPYAIAIAAAGIAVAVTWPNAVLLG